ELTGVGLEPKVARTKRNLFSGQGGCDADVLAVVHVVTAVRTIDPAVKAPAQAVDAELLVARVKPGKESCAHVRQPVPVTITQQKNVGRSRNQASVAPSEYSRGKTQ